ncbi:hypothetical protein F8G81_08410 [Arthrobacter sp. CDRTa11]|uniref:hypothetical protein n=1 Tax=Arthrobacter sp. CDRTa11 TaxID=2651199 RepID=UPI0022659E6F|nr:hypothetical protein [Arthrobacter sp. CDRTa11]UZX02632.1 hypothetical protein F8G81_08410 [Arthrobacter sp. CDRTa11]
MDRIEQLMKDAKPMVGEPPTAAAAIAARSAVFTDDPDVVSLSGHRSARRARVRAAVVAVAAAAVVGAVVLAGGMGVPEPGPGPAATTNATTAPSTTTPPPPSTSPTATATAPPPATEPPGATAPAALTTGGIPCVVANIDQPAEPARTIGPIAQTEQGYYTVLGCAEGWLAYSISDDGARALQLDGGNAWYRIAKLENGRFVFDVQAPWSTVFSWEFQALNNDVSQNGQRVTAQEAMDQEFAQKGIPVELRPQLVGQGPADPSQQ